MAIRRSSSVAQLHALVRPASAVGLIVLIGLSPWPVTLAFEGTPPSTQRVLPASLAEASLAFTAAPDLPPMGATSEVRCDRCHRFEPLLSHPVQVMPTMATPASLPLTDNRMTCLTCHNQRAAQPHGASTGTGPARDMMLRIERPTGSASAASLCVQCHSNRGIAMGAGSDPGAAAHIGAIDRAHLGRRHTVGRSLPLAFGPRRMELDSETVTCVSCHDGSMAGQVDLGAPASTNTSRSDTMTSIGRSHPVGIALTPGRDQAPGSMAIRQSVLIDHRIRLFNDSRQTIGCGSCHSPYSPEDHMLVMSNDRSALCLNCHRD